MAVIVWHPLFLFGCWVVEELSMGYVSKICWVIASLISTTELPRSLIVSSVIINAEDKTPLLSDGFQPLLLYRDEVDDGQPPLSWACISQDSHSHGCIICDSGQLLTLS